MTERWVRRAPPEILAPRGPLAPGVPLDPEASVGCRAPQGTMVVMATLEQEELQVWLGHLARTALRVCRGEQARRVRLATRVIVGSLEILVLVEMTVSMEALDHKEQGERKDLRALQGPPDPQESPVPLVPRVQLVPSAPRGQRAPLAIAVLREQADLMVPQGPLDHLVILDL